MGMSCTLNCGKHARLSTILSRNIAKLVFSLGQVGAGAGDKMQQQPNVAKTEILKSKQRRVTLMPGINYLKQFDVSHFCYYFFFRLFLWWDALLKKKLHTI